MACPGSCIGVRALAPVVTVNDGVYSRVTPNQVPELIDPEE